MRRAKKNKKTKRGSTRCQATALIYIMVGIRLFVVLFAIGLTWLLIHDQAAHGNPVSTAGTLTYVALAASKVAERITDLSTFLL